MISRMPPAAILAGGLGTRIRSVGGDVPKVLLPVEGRPFLSHLLELLAREGIRDTVLCLGHQADLVAAAAHLHTSRAMQVTESREPKALGTGGAVRLALPHLEGTFFLVNGDTYLDVDLGALWRAHREASAVLTVALFASEKAAEKGSVACDATGRIVKFSEKTAEGTGLINAGVYVVERSLFRGVPENTPVSLEREIIPRALAAGATMRGVEVPGPFVDIGLPDDYLGVRDGLPRRKEAS